jgi:hypothetical protein
MCNRAKLDYKEKNLQKSLVEGAKVVVLIFVSLSI